MIHTLTDNQLLFYMLFGYVCGIFMGFGFCWVSLRKAQENDKLNSSTINIGGVIYQSGKEVK